MLILRSRTTKVNQDPPSLSLSNRGAQLIGPACIKSPVLQLTIVISKIKLYNFRSYELYETTFGQKGTVIVGPNGTGKTNLLEAVYIALCGTTFRGSLVDCMRHGVEQTIIQIETDDATRRVQLLRTDNDKISREFTINDSRSKVLSRKNRLPVVLFEPNELRLITSSPARRRDFLDGLMSRLDSKYETTLRAFNRTLLQRNELLKQNQPDSRSSWRDHLFAWDIKFVQLSAQIAQARATFLYSNEAQLGELYSSLAGKKTEFNIEYLPSVALENYEQLLLDRLQRAREYEIATGHTSAGPQREDFLISLHSQPAIKVASRGEMRTIMLAFKLLELELQTAHSSVRPLILMDDVFSELDATREQLLQEAVRDNQFIITATEAKSHANSSIYEIINI